MATATSKETRTFTITLDEAEAEQLTTMLSRYSTTLDDLYQRLTDAGVNEWAWEEHCGNNGNIDLVRTQ